MPQPFPHLDPDPLETLLADEATADHAHAKRRGERVQLLAESLASTLHARGLLRGSKDDAVVELFGPLADDLYGNAAIDTPTLRRDQ